MREAMRKAGDALLVAGGIKKPAKVLPMRKRKTAGKARAEKAD